MTVTSISVPDQEEQNEEVADAGPVQVEEDCDVPEPEMAEQSSTSLLTATFTATEDEAEVSRSEDNDDEEDDDEDDVTVIVLNNSNNGNNNRSEMMSWIEHAGPELEERRRNVLLRELRRVQRASFIHFALLCVVPTILLLVVIATVMGEEEECVSDVTFCELEPRSFVTAFTTRCICDAIPVQRDE